MKRPLSINVSARSTVSPNATITTSPLLGAKQINSLGILLLGSEELLDQAVSMAQENPFLALRSGKRPPDQATGAFDYEVDSLPARPDSLFQRLLQQINDLNLNRVDHAIALELLSGLDHDGYYRDNLPDRVPSSIRRRVQSVLDQLRELSPFGVFSQSLSEFLARQLQASGQLDSTFNTILCNSHLLAEKRFEDLATTCDCSPAEVHRRLGTLALLDAAPSADDDRPNAQVVAPELSIFPDASGRWTVEYTPAHGLDLKLDHALKAKIEHARLSREDAVYARLNWRNAQDFVTALERRAATLIRIGELIAERQGDFLMGRRPWKNGFVMREVAEATRLHESTISRAVSGKYFACPIGTLELRSLFEAGLRRRGSEGTVVSDGQVKACILNLIRQEYAPLSDLQLSHLLQQQGLPASRRTVAKYRSELNIPSSKERSRAVSHETP